MTDKLRIENAKLRAKISQIGGLANAWKKEVQGISLNMAGKFDAIETACSVALNDNTENMAYVQLGCSIFHGEIIDTNPIPSYPEWVEILVADDDPSAAPFSVTGPAFELATKPPATAGKVGA